MHSFENFDDFKTKTNQTRLSEKKSTLSGDNRNEYADVFLNFCGKGDGISVARYLQELGCNLNNFEDYIRQGISISSLNHPKLSDFLTNFLK